ncbi:MAG: sigma-70 family RNA polymerase sigma factor [Planctomycetota bacterium]|nr:sigma-70 family RNA polymerase sigma factor [Planctomycetota bacterium]
MSEDRPGVLKPDLDTADAAASRDAALGPPSRDPAVRRRQFEDLAMPLARTLHAAAYRLTRHAARAEDLVQESYVRAWQNFDRFTLGTNFKAWLFRIMTLLYRNERRSAKSREVTMDPATSEQVLPAAAGERPADEARVDWDAAYPALVDDEFKRALDRLDEDQRAVFLLVTLGELSYKDCADALEIPIGTVMSRLFRARKQLQDELGAYARERGLAGSRGAE